MAIIRVQDVSKKYKVFQQKAGAMGAIKSFIHPTYKSIRAVQDMSFDIEEGDFIGFIGENGAGKSTMIKMMSGILHPSAGEINVCGLIPYKKRRENAMNIGVVFGQRSRLVWELPMEDTFSLYKEIYRIEPAAYRKNVDMFVEMLSMGEYVKTPIRQLSLGQRMRVEIALAMLHDPRILFLDEPTIGLDVVAKKYIRDFFRERNARDGVTIILTSHDMKDLDAIARRIIMITKGTLLFDGSLDELRAQYSEKASVEFSYSSSLDRASLPMNEDVALDQSGHKLTVSFNPREKKLQEVIAMAGAFGEISDVGIKSADIEDIVREIYNRQ